MATVGNAFAIGLIILIAIVFSRNKIFLTEASKYYAICLTLTALTAFLNTMSIISMHSNTFRAWHVILFTTLDYAFSILTTSILALYLVTKISEHSFNAKYMHTANVFLLINFFVYAVTLILNLPFEFYFGINENGRFSDGPLFFVPYLFIIPQILFLFVCCLKNKKGLSKAVKLALLESLTVTIICLVIKLIYKEIIIFLLVVSFIELVFFLAFQRQKMGINGITKLYDSRTFLTEIKKLIKRNAKFKAYIIKLNNIGVIKQNYGHKIGDELLYQFAFSLERLFIGGLSFHLHGLTFAVIVPDDSEDSERSTEKLTDFMENGIIYLEKKLPLDYNIAEYSRHEDESNAEIFYEKLEYAAETAKEYNQKHLCYTLDLEVNRLRQKYLINRLQKISAEEGFETWFQPIYNTETRSFTSMEVLLRLKEKNGSFISPAEFIPLAEKTGQIVPITWFVIEETCKVLAENKVLDGITASINLPMIHLTDKEFEPKLTELVSKYGIQPERISFEFTERVIIDDLELAEKNMRYLESSGYSFYLDDFGIGYSNFNCVLKLPLKTVKLDISLSNASEKTDKNNLVYILTDLFHDMGLKVIAEGAETLEQVEQMTSYGVDGIQGYYFAKPMPLSKLKSFLESKK